MSNDYHLEDALMAACPHPSSVILWTRLCGECGTILEEEVITPGTDARMQRVTMEVQP